jgi:hypothetical protein
MAVFRAEHERLIPLFVWISTESVKYLHLLTVDELLAFPSFERILNCVSMLLYVIGL